MTHIATTRIGSLDVTVLTDGARSFPPALFPGTSAETIDALLAAAGETEIRTNFNAMLARGGGRTVLVDAGGRDLMGDAAGRLPLALKEAGCAPARWTCCSSRTSTPTTSAAPSPPRAPPPFPPPNW